MVIKLSESSFRSVSQYNEPINGTWFTQFPNPNHYTSVVSPILGWSMAVVHGLAVHHHSCCCCCQSVCLSFSSVLFWSPCRNSCHDTRLTIWTPEVSCPGHCWVILTEIFFSRCAFPELNFLDFVITNVFYLLHFSKTDCLKSTLFQRWQPMCPPPGKNSSQLSFLAN